MSPRGSPLSVARLASGAVAGSALAVEGGRHGDAADVLSGSPPDAGLIAGCREGVAALVGTLRAADPCKAYSGGQRRKVFRVRYTRGGVLAAMVGLGGSA